MAGSSQVGEGKQVRLPEEEKPDLEHLVQVHRHPDSPIVRCLCPKLAAGAPPPYFCVQSSTLIAPTCAVTRPNHHQSCCHGDTRARFHHLPYISWSLAVCDSGNVCRQPTIPPPSPSHSMHRLAEGHCAVVLQKVTLIGGDSDVCLGKAMGKNLALYGVSFDSRKVG